jgi:hypothetical protein
MAASYLVEALTGCGMLVLFEPSEIVPFIGERSDWYTEDKILLSLANQGLLLPLNVRVDGAYRCRITDSGLQLAEKPYLVQSEDKFWLKISDSELAVGGMESLPTRIGKPDKLVDEFGGRIPFHPGTYKFIVHKLVHPDDSIRSELPDYVISYRIFQPGEAIPLLDTIPDLSFLKK